MEERTEKRGAKPGERRGGRRKGSLNKRTLLHVSVVAACEEAGYSPAETLIELASNSKYDPSVRGKAAAELCSYLYAKKKAVEVSGVGGSPIEHSHIIGGNDGSPLERIVSELARLRSGRSDEQDSRVDDAGATPKA